MTLGDSTSRRLAYQGAFRSSPSSSSPPADVCSQKRSLRIPYHNKADGFTAALVLTLNQVKFCELHACQPRVVWGMYPKCKYAGVRFPGRTPFFDARQGPNAFEYYFLPICDGEPAQQGPPMLTCEQRERVHRQLPWSVPRKCTPRTGASALRSPKSSAASRFTRDRKRGRSRR